MTELTAPEGSRGKGSQILRGSPQLDQGSGLQSWLCLSPARASGQMTSSFLGLSFLYGRMGIIYPPLTG